MNILHTILTKGFAGSERSTAESCNAQCQRHQVTLVVRRGHRGRGGASIVDHLDPRVQVEEVPARFFTKRHLGRITKRVQPDIIHCHLRRSTRLVAELKPACATASTLHITYNGPHFGAMSGLICNAKWQLADIPADYPGQVFKANNSLQPHPRLAPDAITQLREKLGGSELLHIAGVGRLSRSKGWDLLIDAFQQADLPDTVRLSLFGAGSQERQLRQRIHDPRIQLCGYRQDIKDYYQAFDLLVCPSRFEPLPRVMLEAMDGGAPVLASDTGGCRELIEDYGGELFPAGDVEALASVLARLCQAPPPRHRPDLSAHYVARTAIAMEEFYRSLIDQLNSQSRMS